MPFNGAGGYSPPGTDFPAVPGALIQSTKFNNVVNDLATALSIVLTRDGQQISQAAQPMGGFRHTNVGNAVNRNEYATAGQVQDKSFQWCGTAGGTAADITITPAPAITAYAAGQTFVYKSGAAANAGAMTVAVNGLATKAIQKDGAAVVANDHPANRWFRITYDGAAFQLEQLSPITARLAAYLPLGGGTMTGALILANGNTAIDFPAGTRMLFQQTAAPTGWTKEASATYDNAALRFTTGAVGTGGADNFTTHFGAGKSTANYTLLNADVPAHVHGLNGGTGIQAGPGGGGGNTYQTAAGALFNAISLFTATDSSGGGGPHAHSLSNFDIKFADCIIAVKN